MMNRSEIRRRVQALKQGDVIHVDTNVDIQDREFHVERIEPAELHIRDGDKHYRVYVSGTGNPKGVGQYVIHLDRPEWSERTSDHAPPELFYIEDGGLPAGRGEYTEGSITRIE